MDSKAKYHKKKIILPKTSCFYLVIFNKNDLSFLWQNRTETRKKETCTMEGRHRCIFDTFDGGIKIKKQPA